MIRRSQIIEMIKMQIEGVATTSIAEKFGVTKGRIYKLTNRPENKELKQLMMNRIAEASADEIIAGVSVMPDVSDLPKPDVYVYFLQGKVTKLIKIGLSSNPRKRIKSLQLSEEVEFLGVIKGDKRLEDELHYRFADYRKIGEWFEPAPELVAFISKHSSHR